MELFSTESHFILVNETKSLWVNRHTCQFSAKADFIPNLTHAVSLGLVYGFIGKVQFGESAEPRLVFIRHRSRVGKLKDCDIFKITSVIAIPLESDGELLLEPCRTQHITHEDHSYAGTTSSFGPRPPVKVRPLPLAPAKQRAQLSPKDMERASKVESRMLDEFYKMFTEADSFYYSKTYDLTNSVQRQTLSSGKDRNLALWYGADLRFFWNYYMLADLIQSPESGIGSDWVMPIIQGFVQNQHCKLNYLHEPVGITEETQGSIDVWLISRRCRFRAGTRYLKRGIDETGKVANYVETEQILVYRKHVISFVMTRGSVPVYWSQPGNRYRPPPRLDRSKEENYSAFRQHIEEEGVIYGPVVMINLMDKLGKEKVLGDAFLENILKHNSAEVAYFSFDFHENCRGMHFENVQLLIDKLDERMKAMNYCWVDPFGIVLTQTGVCRVNCVDCLDRTNIVQSFIGKHILGTQMCKLGLISPEFGIPDVVRKSLQMLWANNGDTISKQYAGTSALKGDYTRTGERRFAGALKDGMNSANRYYLNRFRDATRQAVIDITLGVRANIPDDEFEAEKLVEERENMADQLKTIIEDTRKCIIPKFDVILGSWGLVNAKESDSTVVDVDTILILTETAYYVTGYDCLLDNITSTEKVKLTAITSIEFGYETTTHSMGFLALLVSGTGSGSQSPIPTLRINYVTSGSPYSHKFRSSNMRFFNNVCVPIHQPEEMLDALKVIGDTIQIGAVAQGNQVPIKQFGRLVKSGTNKLSSENSSWRQRYLNFNNQPDIESTSGQKLMRIEKSFERFTPKYFRRSSAADAARREEALSVPGVVDVLNVEGLKEAEESQDEMIHQGGSNSFDLVPPEYLESPNLLRLASRDLILSSCGVIAVPNVTLGRPAHPFSPSFLIPGPSNDGERSIGLSASCSQEDLAELDPTYNVPRRQHRFSLPTSALMPSGVGPIRTPEIKITEDLADLQLGSFPTSHPSLRMSKSSEDVVKLINPVSPPQLGSQLKPMSCQDSGRSTSDQDLSLCSLDTSMTGSHSESSIKVTTHPFQRFRQGRGLGNPQFKKEVVLAPLGKLANYLHPKKLKESFKPGRKETTTETLSRQEDPLKNKILEERKLNCNSLIVDL